MVSYTEILESNNQINEENVPKVIVSVSATSGIGKYTIEAFVRTGLTFKVYVVGRKSSEERTKVWIQDMHNMNDEVTIIWIEAEVSLLAEVKKACEEIKKLEVQIDLLMLTAGYAPFGERKETGEGLEVAQSLEYYSRMLFIQLLLPLLHRSTHSRVLSVLGGGMEMGTINVEDIDLRQPGSFTSLKAQPHYISLNTVTLDEFSQDNPEITFIHSWPGWVDTGNVRRGIDPNSGWGWFSWLILEPLIKYFSFTHEVSGQRNMYIATSATLGGHGMRSATGKDSGFPGDGPRVILAGWKCDSKPNTKALASLRQQAQQKVWEHTQRISNPYL